MPYAGFFLVFLLYLFMAIFKGRILYEIFAIFIFVYLVAFAQN